MARQLFSTLALAAGAMIVAGQPAWASDADCRGVPRAQWRSIEEAVVAVKAKGYEVRKIEIDDGCYEVHASGSGGERVKLYLDPGSLDIVRSRRRS